MSVEGIDQLERSLAAARAMARSLKVEWSNQRNVDGYRVVAAMEERLRQEEARIGNLHYTEGRDPVPISSGRSEPKGTE